MEKRSVAILLIDRYQSTVECGRNQAKMVQVGRKERRGRIKEVAQWI